MRSVRVAMRGLLVAAMVVGCAGLAREAHAAKGPVKVFILAGQSNMEGKAQIVLLEHQIKAPETKALFAHLHKDGKWVVRDDVWINFLNRKGNLTVGFGSPGRIGPELEFGNAVGDHFEEQVLIIKTAWGGKSLGRDFRPPSSGLPSDEKLQAILTKTNESNRRRKRPEVSLDDVKAGYGKFYRDMMAEVETCLKELKTRFPDYAGQGYEIAGFVWFQGWNDMFDTDFAAGYATHMANFIRDVRKDLKAPKLPFVIGVMGHNGPKPASGNMAKIKEAQASMGAIPEFKGNVAIVQTDQFWDLEADAVYRKGWSKHLEEWKKVGSDRPYHYLGSAKFFTRVGTAFGKAMLALHAKRQ
ncbi:MAG: sialate O-acetylesterase [Candidatus Brocadiae bacterium]|nr:sialate O-acetylesterase [Candidatus Brocadiia bacterium]